MSEGFSHSREEHSVQPPTDFDDGGSRRRLRRRGVLKTLGVAGTAAFGSWSAVSNVAAASQGDDDGDDEDED